MVKENDCFTLWPASSDDWLNLFPHFFNARISGSCIHRPKACCCEWRFDCDVTITSFLLRSSVMRWVAFTWRKNNFIRYIKLIFTGFCIYLRSKSSFSVKISFSYSFTNILDLFTNACTKSKYLYDVFCQSNKGFSSIVYT